MENDVKRSKRKVTKQALKMWSIISSVESLNILQNTFEKL